jgi:hypothetical protein
MLLQVTDSPCSAWLGLKPVSPIGTASIDESIELVEAYILADSQKLQKRSGECYLKFRVR